MTKLIIIDDNPDDREWLADVAAQAGWTDVAAFDSAGPALDVLDEKSDVLVLLDYNLEHRVGIVHLGAIWARAPQARVILITGQASDTIVQIADLLGLGFMSKDDIKIDDLIQEEGVDTE